MRLVTIEQQQFLDSLLKLLKNMACRLACAVIKVVKIMKLAGMLNHPNREPGQGSIIVGWYYFYVNFHYAQFHSYWDC